jgi:flagellar biosynthesis protein FlhB
VSGGGGGEKTEQPTEKKLREARKEGQVARSPDFGAWFGVLAAVSVLPLVIDAGSELCRRLMAAVTGIVAEPDPARATAALVEGLQGVAFVVAPLAATTVVVAVATGAAQGGLRPATKLLKPKWNRLSPKAGIKRIAGPQAWWEGTKLLIKSTAVGLVMYGAVRGIAPDLVDGGALPLSATLGVVADATITLVRLAAMAGLVIAVGDYLVARRRIGKQLRMTKAEVKQEHKSSDGDPLLKGAIRSKQLAMSRNRMMSAVAEADVLLVNPTHVAVALRYDPAKGAPRVVAKGAGAVAAKIRERASEHRVPMVQDVPLARALYKACEVNAEIPPEMYAAVARVLAFVMSLRARGSAAGLHRPPALPAA